MMGAMGATAGANGARAWLGTRHFKWLTPARKRRVTIALMATAVLGSGLIKGSDAAPVHHAPAAPPAAQVQHQR